MFLLLERSKLEHLLRKLENQELYVFRFANIGNSSAWGKNYKKSPQASLSIGFPSPPLST